MNPEATTKNRVIDPSNSRPSRWIVLGSAAALALGWAAWFVWLVVVELAFERHLIFHRGEFNLTFGGPIDSEWMTYRQAVEGIARSYEIAIEADWAALAVLGIQPDEKVHTWHEDRQNIHRYSPPPPVALSPTHGHSEGGVVSTPTALDILTHGIGPQVAWHIEGKNVVITTEDRSPRFDASTRARQWWRNLHEW